MLSNGMSACINSSPLSSSRKSLSSFVDCSHLASNFTDPKQVACWRNTNSGSKSNSERAEDEDMQHRHPENRVLRLTVHEESISGTVNVHACLECEQKIRPFHICEGTSVNLLLCMLSYCVTEVGLNSSAEG